MAHEVDIEVGAKIRAARVARGMSQTDLGAACGITFQQIQKYEKGKNRVGSSRIVQIATALGVTPGYFFDQYDGYGAPVSLFSREAIRIANQYDALMLSTSRDAARKVMQMVVDIEADMVQAVDSANAA